MAYRAWQEEGDLSFTKTTWVHRCLDGSSTELLKKDEPRCPWCEMTLSIAKWLRSREKQGRL